jgi:protein-tyrosine-phosphatase
MAEGIFRYMTRDRNDIQVSSAGVGTVHGQPPSLHAVEVLKPFGIDISRIRSQPLDDDLVDSATHIFAMTLGHLETIRMLFPEAADKAYLLGEFEESLRRNPEVPDPIGLGLDAYLRCRDTIRRALPSVLQFIDQSAPMSSPEIAAAPAPTTSPVLSK